MLSITKRIAQEQGIVDFSSASDDQKLKIYRLTIKEMFDRLVHEDLETFPLESLEEFKSGLKEIIAGLYKLRIGPIGNQLKWKQIISIVDAANSDLIAALHTFRKGKRTYSNIQHLQKCRSKLFDTLEQLQGF